MIARAQLECGSTNPMFSAQVTANRSNAWLVVALLVVVLISLPNITYPIGRDQATYCVIGQGLLHGQQLYRDLWDIKPPGIFYIYALLAGLFGPVMWSVGMADILWLLAISYCIFLFAERYVGPIAAFIGVVINAAWHCRAGYVHAAQPEGFLILFVFAGYFLISRGDRWTTSRHIAAGLLMGAAFWIKYNALVFVPFLLLTPYLDWRSLQAQPPRARLSLPWRTWITRSVALLAGFVAAVVAVLMYFGLAGLWEVLWKSHFEIVARYGVAPIRDWEFYWLVPVVGTVHRVGLLTLAATGLAFVIARRRRELPNLGPILFGATVGYASAAIQIRFQTYAFETCYPFFAMIWAYLAVRILGYFRAFERKLAARASHLAQIGLWVLGVNAAFLLVLLGGLDSAKHYRGLRAWLDDPQEFYENYPGEYPLEHLGSEMRVIAYLEKESAPGEKVYVWGTAPLIYFLAGLHSPTRFIPNHPLMSPWAPSAWREELIHDLTETPPAFIVVARNDQAPSVTSNPLDSEQVLRLFPEMQALLGGSYDRVATFADFVVYRRRGLAERLSSHLEFLHVPRRFGLASPWRRALGRRKHADWTDCRRSTSCLPVPVLLRT